MNHWQDIVKGGDADFEVEKRPLFYDGPTQSPRAYGLWDKTNQREVGVCGTGYRVIQPAQAFSVLDRIAEMADGNWLQAGTFKNGSIVHGTLDLPGQRYEVRPGDVIEPKAVFLAGFGTVSVQYFATTFRLWCKNQLNALQRKARREGRRVSIRHTGDVNAKLEDAARVLESILLDVEAQRVSFRRLARKTADVTFVERVFPMPVRREGVDLEEILRAQERVEETRAVVSELIARGRGNDGTTLWDQLNGVTEYVDSQLATGKRVKDSAAYVTIGAGAALKARAYETAVELL